MPELITVVDENDQVIGAKPRGTTTYNDIYQVSALWLTNSEGNVLLAQRKWTKKNNPGKWGPAVAGTVDEGESYEQNIYQEAEEEIGLTEVKFISGPKTFVVREGLRRYFCQWFTAQIDWPLSRFKIQESEVEQIVWMPLQQLGSEIEKHPDNYVEGVINWEQLFGSRRSTVNIPKS